MQFIDKSLGSEAALTMGVNKALLSKVPVGIYLSGAALGRIKGKLATTILVTTPSELIIYGKDSIEVWRKPLMGMKADSHGTDVIRFIAKDNDTVDFTTGLSSRKKLLAHIIEAERVTHHPEEIEIRLFTEKPRVTVTPAMFHADEPPTPHPWPEAKVVGSRLTKKASQAIFRVCNDDQPWFILVSSGRGVLVAFEDRLAIIKTGAVTSFFAGSFGGERSTTIYFKDVNALEYNSGMVTGVLEVLTASYNGTANRDHWRGSGKSRNSDSNDPYTLSNTLPLGKWEYTAVLTQIKELRSRIAKTKETSIVVNVPQQYIAPSATSIADDLSKLFALRNAGALSEEEFLAMKVDVMAGSSARTSSHVVPEKKDEVNP